MRSGLMVSVESTPVAMPTVSFIVSSVLNSSSQTSWLSLLYVVGVPFSTAIAPVRLPCASAMSVSRSAQAACCTGAHCTAQVTTAAAMMSTQSRALRTPHSNTSENARPTQLDRSRVPLHAQHVQGARVVPHKHAAALATDQLQCVWVLLLRH